MGLNRIELSVVLIGLGALASCGGGASAARERDPSEIAAEAAREAKARKERFRIEADLETRRAFEIAIMAAHDSRGDAASDASVKPAVGGGPVDPLARIALTTPATVQLDERGTIIAIPDQALFAGDDAALAPSAVEMLNLAADALRDVDGGAIMVEGYAAAEGDDAANRELSQRRAEAVGTYLVSRGVAAERVRARGLGCVRPVADNGTIAGRARNRRVEIVVAKAEAK